MIFTCPIKGCDATFIRLKERDEHMQLKHCEECGNSKTHPRNPIDYSKCDACNGTGPVHEPDCYDNYLISRGIK